VARTATATELSVLADSYRRVSPVRVEIQNGSGTWKALTNLSGTGFSGLNFFKGATWTDDVDAATWTGTVTLAESLKAASGAEISIAPDVESSPANVDDTLAYNPLIDGMRRIRWYTTTGRLGGVDASEQKAFDGYVVNYAQQSQISLRVADLGHLLVITQIEDERTYGTPAGVTLSSVIQQILDDNMGVGAYTLVVEAGEVATAMVREFKQDRVKVMEAIRSLAQLTVGANVRFMWNAAGEMELRLFMPPRNKTTPDFTFSADNYEPVPSFERNTEDIRNKGRLYYKDKGKQTVVFVPGKVQESIDRYFPRYFEFREIAAKHVVNETAATTMLDKALSDMAFPKAEKKFTTLYSWRHEVHDLFTMSANGKQYTTDQPMFVTRVTHTLGGPKETRSAFELRGTVAGFYSRWKILIGPAETPVNDDVDTVSLGMGGEGSMYGGELFNGIVDGCVWPYLFLGLNIKRVHIWHRETPPGATVTLWPPTGSDMYKAVTIDRPEGRIPREGNYTFPDLPIHGPRAGKRVWRILVPLPTTPDSTAGVIIQAETFEGKFGAQERLEAVATDVGTDPGSLSTLDVTRINATTVRVTGSGAGTNAVLILRDGINIDQITPVAGSFTWDDEELHAERSYKYEVFLLSNATSGERTTVFIDPWAPDLAFADDTPSYAVLAGGESRVKIAWSGTPVGTTHVRVLKSRDSGHYDPWTVATTVAVAAQPWYDVVVYAGQFYQLQALDGPDGNVLDTSDPAYWSFRDLSG
jgi:hypothetical protein